MVLNLLTYYAKVVLDSPLQINYGVQVSQWIADASHRVKGTKEVYDLPHKVNHYRRWKGLPWILVEECSNSLPLALRSVKWRRKVHDLYLSRHPI